MKKAITSIIALFFLSNCVVVLDPLPLYTDAVVYTPYNQYYVPSGNVCSTVYGSADLYRSYGTTIRTSQGVIQC